MTDDYRNLIYDRYVSLSKAAHVQAPSYKFNNSKILPLIEEWVKPIDKTAPCIDLGCGNGSLLNALKTLGFSNLFGVDISPEQIGLARRIVPNVAKGDLVEYLERFDRDYFGLICLFDVIEHLKKTEVVHLLELIHSRLLPGGTLIVHCPNGDSPFCSQIHFGDFTHETILSPSSAQNLCLLFNFGRFEAKEHLGASLGVVGRLRYLAWRGLRLAIQLCHVVETGSRGSGVCTRNFAFKAIKT